MTVKTRYTPQGRFIADRQARRIPRRELVENCPEGATVVAFPANNTVICRLQGTNTMQLRFRGVPVLTYGPRADGRGLGWVQIDPYGWRTMTTKARINKQLKVLGAPLRVFQKDWKWRLWGACVNDPAGPWRDLGPAHDTVMIEFAWAPEGAVGACCAPVY